MVLHGIRWPANTTSGHRGVRRIQYDGSVHHWHEKFKQSHYAGGSLNGEVIVFQHDHKVRRGV